MSLVDGVKAAVLLFVAAIAQVSIFSQLHVFGAVPDLLLVSLVALSPSTKCTTSRPSW